MSLHLSKCHMDGKHMTRLKSFISVGWINPDPLSSSAGTRFIQASLCNIQGLFKDF